MAVSLNWLQFVSFEEIFACGRKTISVISKSSFESLVRHSDIWILWSGCVFVIHQCGWLVMKATKPIIGNSYVCWKNEHQTFLSLPAFLASQEAVLVLWYMCLVQLTIIIFFLCVCVWSSYFFIYIYIFFPAPFSMFDKMSWTEIPEKQVSLYWIVYALYLLTGIPERERWTENRYGTFIAPTLLVQSSK